MQKPKLQFKIKNLLISLFVICYLLFVTATNVAAGELEDIERELAELTNKLQMSQKATAPLEADLFRMEKQLANIRSRISSLELEVARKERQVKEGEENLSQQQLQLERRIREFYKKSSQFSSSGLRILLANSDNFSNIIRLAIYNQKVLTKDRDEIVQLVLFIKNLEEKKAQLQDEKSRLSTVKEQTDKQAAFLRKEVKGAKEYQAQLSGKIAALTARQQSILASRLGSLNLPVSLGAGPLYCTDDRNINPGFSPAFAFYTYGIPHRVGMNQYGALGRAKAGQGYQDILRAYFNGISFEGGRENIRIKVKGFGEMGLEDYLLGVYEMPESWPIEALKAQAIAARSYALSYTNNGKGEICATQACQVYKGGNKGGNWERAVRETSGQVMVNNGEVIKAWYSSTDGGYTFTSGDVWGSNKAWTKRTRDTSGDINSFEDLNRKSYDKDSPCFYAAQGWRSEFGKSAWLKPSEVADIVNALMLAKRDSSTGEHLYQTDKPHPYGGEVWNKDRVKSELKSRGITPFDNISSISVGANFSEGKTASITISGSAGSKTFSGEEFKNYFNLRAPANIQIVGALFNIERK